MLAGLFGQRDGSLLNGSTAFSGACRTYNATHKPNSF